MLALLVIVGSLLFVTCKKQGKPQPVVKTTLLSKSVLFGGSYTNVYTYTYDDKNRVSELNSSYLSTIYKFNYDGNNNLVTTELYDYNNQLGEVYKFSYSGNTVTVLFYDESGNRLFTKYVMTLNAMQLPETISNEGQPILTYTYDSAGNVTNVSENGPGSPSVKYDDEKNPMSMIGAKNYFLMYFWDEINYPATIINNEVSGAQTCSYVYNADGFPTIRNYSGSSIYMTFEYVVK
jgi:hypothetical protein